MYFRDHDDTQDVRYVQQCVVSLCVLCCAVEFCVGCSQLRMYVHTCICIFLYHLLC